MTHTSLDRLTVPAEPSDVDLKSSRRESRRHGLFAPELLKSALCQSFVMLRPDIQWKNPVMFVVEVGTVLSILFTIARLFGDRSGASLGYQLASVFAGGLSPLIATALVAWSGGAAWPVALYVGGLSVVTLVAVAASVETSRTELDADQRAVQPQSMT